jgi:hypothetical protein
MIFSARGSAREPDHVAELDDALYQDPSLTGLALPMVLGAAVGVLVGVVGMVVATSVVLVTAGTAGPGGRIGPEDGRVWFAVGLGVLTVLVAVLAAGLVVARRAAVRRAGPASARRAATVSCLVCGVVLLGIGVAPALALRSLGLYLAGLAVGTVLARRAVHRGAGYP